MASNKGRAFFALAGYHFNPDDITKTLGLEPTSTNHAGTGGSLDKPVTSYWELSTETIEDEVDIYKLTDIIIKQLEPVEDKIRDIATNLNLSPRIGVVLELSVDKDEISPDVGFGGRCIRFLADIGAFIDVEYKLSKRI